MGGRERAVSISQGEREVREQEDRLCFTPGYTLCFLFGTQHPYISNVFDLLIGVLQASSSQTGYS